MKSRNPRELRRVLRSPLMALAVRGSAGGLGIGLSFRRKAVIKGSTPPLGVGGSPGTLSEAAKIEDS